MATAVVEPADSSRVISPPDSYAERYVCRTSDPFVGRCRAAAKEHALQVLANGPGTPQAAVGLAQRIALDQLGPYTITDLVTADGITTIGATDQELILRWSEVFALLATSAPVAESQPSPSQQPQAVILAPRPVPAG